MRRTPFLRPERPNQSGMTLLEMIVAMAMLVVFTGVVVLVMQFTLRFFADAESEGNALEVSNGVLIDHQEIQIAMDHLVEVLSQPGIDVDVFALNLNDPGVNLQEDCVLNPVKEWELPMSEVSLPSGYRMCLWRTTEAETRSIQNSVLTVNPGLYLLQALPEQLNPTSLPARRLFCRPRPFC